MQTLSRLILGKFLFLATMAANASVVVGTPNNNNCVPFGCGVGSWGNEYQQVYSSSVFNGPIDISSLTFYNTFSDSGNYSLDTGTFQIFLSTTSASVNGLSSNLSSNIGQNETLVYSGTLPENSTSGFGGQFLFALASGFEYDPSSGNLLLTVTSSDAEPSSSYPPAIFLDAQYASGVMSRAYNTPNFPETDAEGLVTGFNLPAVSEPSTYLMMMVGMFGWGLFTRFPSKKGLSVPYVSR